MEDLKNKPVEIFDTTILIAFLNELDYQEVIITLSKHYGIIIPKGVVDEIIKLPGNKLLQDLIMCKIVKIVEIDQPNVDIILNEYLQLHKGECETIAFIQTCSNKKNIRV